VTRAEPTPRKRIKPPTSLGTNLEEKLREYAAAASAAGVGILAFMQPAEGRIVYKKAHVTILDSSHYLLLNDKGIPNFLVSNHYYTSPGLQYFIAALQVEAMGRKSFLETSASSRLEAAAALSAGDIIPPSKGSHRFKPGGFMLQFVQVIVPATGLNRTSYLGKWRDANDRYLGLKFQTRGKTHYGWARLSITNDRHCAGLLTGYAYETVPNKPIIAGKTKDADDRQVHPATLGHLARGASAIPGWRVTTKAATVR
jgi:hypothetical protein